MKRKTFKKENVIIKQVGFFNIGKFILNFKIFVYQKMPLKKMTLKENSNSVMISATHKTNKKLIFKTYLSKVVE